MDASGDLPALPFPQPDPLSPRPRLRQLQAQGSVTRVRTLAGDEAWYLTRYREVRQLLGDDRLGRSHPDPEHAPRISDSILFEGPLEGYATEAEDHAHLHQLLTPFFAPWCLAALRPQVESPG